MWSSLYAALANAFTAVRDATVLPPPTLVDRRATAQARIDGKPYKPKHRLWSKTTGICLHQTACLLGERDARWDTVGAHIGITRGGKVEWLHDFDRIIYAANGFNPQTVSIEIDGLYAGIDGDDRTVWDDKSTPQREQGMTVTPEAMRSARQTIRWICGEVARRGGKVNALVAHRQASDSRRNDPGSAIWQQVALPLHAELGLSDGGPGFKIGRGSPIPRDWDPSRTEPY